MCDEIKDDPFSSLAISEEWRGLLATDGRSECSKCGKSRKYFCYTCFIPMESIRGLVPRVQLPLKVDVIKHPREIDGKSTAVHAAVLAPEDVTIYTHPLIPDYSNTSQLTVLVFPDKSARSLPEVFAELASSRTGEEDGELLAGRLQRVVFIDSTWNQCRGIFKDPRIRGLPCIVLSERLSDFWRHQKGSPRTHLATIEAIHQFFLEYHSAIQTPPPLGLDNLLFFFKFMYHKIHTLYDHEDLLAYKRPPTI